MERKERGGGKERERWRENDRGEDRGRQIGTREGETETMHVRSAISLQSTKKLLIK